MESGENEKKNACMSVASFNENIHEQTVLHISVCKDCLLYPEQLYTLSTHKLVPQILLVQSPQKPF